MTTEQVGNRSTSRVRNVGFRNDACIMITLATAARALHPRRLIHGVPTAGHTLNAAAFYNDFLSSRYYAICLTLL